MSKASKKRNKKKRQERAMREPNETTEMWRDYRHLKAEHAAQRRETNTSPIQALQEHGYVVRQLTAFQFRINGVVDLFPTNRRYHHLPTGRRGSYGGESALDAVRRLIPDPPAQGVVMYIDEKPDAEGVLFPDRANPTVPEGARCQETHGMTANRYMRCGELAVAVVDHERGEPAYWMCLLCADHNCRNRRAKLIAVDTSTVGQELWKRYGGRDLPR